MRVLFLSTSYPHDASDWRGVFMRSLVDALARAYRAVGATRTATTRLVHGVRRRVDRSLGSRGAAPTDDAFLAWARERAPARSSDIDLVRQALERPVPRRQLEDVGQALRRLETSLTSFPRSS